MLIPAAKHQSETIPCYSQSFDCWRTRSFHVCPSSTFDQTCSFTLEHFSDMEPQTDIFTCVIDHFVSEQEETRAAAAFAAGK